MDEFKTILMRADKITKRLGNVANRPDIRLAQNLQIVDILMLHWEHMDLCDDGMYEFGAELKKYLEMLRDKEAKTLRSSYKSEEYISDIESHLETLERYLRANDPKTEETY